MIHANKFISAFVTSVLIASCLYDDATLVPSSGAGSGGEGDQGNAGSSAAGVAGREGGAAGKSMTAVGSVAGVAGTAGRSSAVGGSAGHSGEGQAAAGSAGRTNTSTASTAGAAGDPSSKHPSCLNLTVSCQGETCCAASFVPGGVFRMGSTANANECVPASRCNANESPEHNVNTTGYYLDKYEVTVGRFRQFVAVYDPALPKANDGANPNAGTNTGWNVSWNALLPAKKDLPASLASSACNSPTWTTEPGANEAYPINCISWYLAFAFCIWDNGRLPTEAEWEFAAAGGDENRAYPWGNDVPESSRAVYLDGSKGSRPVATGTKSAGKGRWDHLDLAGSMFEWTLDAYSADWYAKTDSEKNNPVNLNTTSTRIARGGSWHDGAQFLRAADRSLSREASSPIDTVGVRCARDKLGTEEL